MKAYTSTYFYAPRENWKIVDIPDDIKIYPVINAECRNMHLGKSETLGKWYTLIDINDTEIGQVVADCGTWVDCICSFDPDYMECPVEFGKTYVSRIVPTVQHIPFYEAIPDGECDDEGLYTYKYVYKVLNMYLPHPSFVHDNPMQYNAQTGFEVSDFGENLVEMVKYLQTCTGIKF